MPNKCRITNTDTAPEDIKTRVATMDLGDNRPMPQIPWPLVQPLPRRVPKPTRKPAVISSPRGKSVRSLYESGKTLTKRNVPVIMPSKKTRRQSHSPAVGVSSSESMPLMPVIRPLKSSITVALRPINKPPDNAVYGVKFSTKSP